MKPSKFPPLRIDWRSNNAGTNYHATPVYTDAEGMPLRDDVRRFINGVLWIGARAYGFDGSIMAGREGAAFGAVAPTHRYQTFDEAKADLEKRAETARCRFARKFCASRPAR